MEKKQTGYLKISYRHLTFAAWLFLAFSVGYVFNYYNLFTFGAGTANKDVNEQTVSEAKTKDQFTQSVIPEKGYTLKINWGDTGKKLVDAGGIDMEKYRENYKEARYDKPLSYLTDEDMDSITITRENAYFWVNTLWALGLTDESRVLTDGVMGTEYKDRVGSFASTGGWTLGKNTGAELFSSSDIVSLNDEQEELVMRVAGNIYRPCCGNSTAFPDCNHGMAILGLLSLMARDGYSEEEMYDAALAFNSYWFTDTYIDLAYYFQTAEDTSWENVDAKRALSADFSSASGYQKIKQEIGTIPGSQGGGVSCGA